MKQIDKKPKILIVTPFFIPGMKGGGPIRSIEGMIFHLKDYFDLYVYTPNKDFGEKEGYPGISYNKWIECDDYFVYYAEKSESLSSIAKLISNIDPNKVYLNSFFPFSIFNKVYVDEENQLN
jgi:hypothetical protein